MLTLEMIEEYAAGRRANNPTRWDYKQGWITLDGERVAQANEAGVVVELWLRSNQPEVDEQAAAFLKNAQADIAARVLINWYRDTTNQWVEV